MLFRSGNDGLLGRWKAYIDTRDGGNKKIKELLCKDPERYHKFQFSILQILPKSASNESVMQCEALYKNKLLSKEFGMNDN